jgi:hypothetical protein
MYNTSLQTSPCEKIVCFFWNSATFLATPEDSRKFWALNVFLAPEFLPLDSCCSPPSGYVLFLALP